MAESADSTARSRARILAAALKEFGARGFRGARIDAIARRARVPRGLIAYYFGTKEGLFQALARERATAIERIQHRVESDPDDPFAWTLGLFAQSGQAIDWVHLMIWEALEWEATTELALDSERRAFWHGRVEAVKRFQKQGRLPAQLDPEHLTFFLYVLGLYPHLLPQVAYLVTGRWPSDEKFDVDFERFVRSLAQHL